MQLLNTHMHTHTYTRTHMHTRTHVHTCTHTHTWLRKEECEPGFQKVAPPPPPSSPALEGALQESPSGLPGLRELQLTPGCRRELAGACETRGICSRGMESLFNHRVCVWVYSGGCRAERRPVLPAGWTHIPGRCDPVTPPTHTHTLQPTGPPPCASLCQPFAGRQGR